MEKPAQFYSAVDEEAQGKQMTRDMSLKVNRASLIIIISNSTPRYIPKIVENNCSDKTWTQM